MIPQQNQITTMTKRLIRECPVCDRTIQIAYSDYCIGCMQELRDILSRAAIQQKT
ncbi:MAG TPA: hypothetical protein VE076_09435 [Nitrososphaeraceae archaeon]|nr:hypothetical protein [Nitrososphaeraceae archaeon]